MAGIPNDVIVPFCNPLNIFVRQGELYAVYNRFALNMAPKIKTQKENIKTEVYNFLGYCKNWACAVLCVILPAGGDVC